MSSATATAGRPAVAARREPGADRAFFPAPPLRVVVEVAVVALVALAYAAVLYHVWDAHWNVPFYEDRPDARGVAGWIKGFVENRWWVHNPRLGAPFAQDAHDFPSNGETTQIIALKILGTLLPNYGWTMNVYYMAGFGLLAATAFLVMRHLRFGFWIAAVVALVYTFLPYHVVHEQSHLTRSTYISGPLAVLLLLWVLGWRSWFLREPEPPPGTRLRANLHLPRVAVAVVLAAFIAATETMSTAFTMSLLAATGVVGAIRWRDPARLAVAGGLIVVMLVTFLFVSIPTLNYWRIHGRNPAAGARAPAETEYYSLKVSRMLLPPGDHRIRSLGTLGEKAQAGSPLPTEGGEYLGLLGIVGFVGGVVALLAHGIRGPTRRDPRSHLDRALLADGSALIALLSFLFGTVSGIGLMLAAVGFSMVRTWDRIEVMLAFAALIVTAVWLERGQGWLRGRSGRPQLAIGAAAVLIAAFGLWDDTPPAPRDYAAMAASWNNDQAFVDAIERRMPTGTMIFQFPPTPFPEAGTLNQMTDYSHLRGYLHDDGTLRWSYGAVKGRPRADWQTVVRNQIGPIGALQPLLGLGFRGYWIDTFGYSPGEGETLVKVVAKAIRTQPIRSRDGRFAFFDLRPFRARLHKSDAQLRVLSRDLLGV